MPNRIQKTAERLRREKIVGSARLVGYRFGRAVLKIFAVKVYERCIAGIALDDPLRGEPDHGQFEFRYLTAVEVAELSSEADGLLPEHLSGRIEANVSDCLAAFDRATQQLAGFLWLAKQGFPPEWIYGPQVLLGPDTAYLYNAVTLANYRGQRLFAQLVRCACRDLERNGVETLFLTVELDNSASHRAVRNAGFESLGLHITVGMPFGHVLKRSKLQQPIAPRSATILAETDNIVLAR